MPDVRGWRVADGRDYADVGRVSGLLFDEGRLRYLDVEIEPDERHVLVPVEYTSVDSTCRCVVVGRATRAELLALPTYVGEPATVTWEYETLIRRAVPAFMTGQTDSGESRAWSAVPASPAPPDGASAEA